jgi:uncharacterized membrane protein
VIIISLRLIHILVGIFWVGSLFFITAFLLPAVRAAGPAGGAVMGQIMQNLKLHRYMVAGSWLTVLSGFGLAWIVSGQLGFQWFMQGSGRFYGAGAILALAAMAVGLAVNAPTAERLTKLAAGIQSAGRAPTGEEQKQMRDLQTKLGQAATLVAVLLTLAAAQMAIARYMN